MAESAAPVYQLWIALREIEPPIWRRVQVLGSMTLPRLHRTIQEVMGWTDSHLHEFVIAGRSYSQPSEEWGPSDVVSERRVRLGDLVHRPNSRFTYIYDFGDDWQHDVRVEKILAPEPGGRYPRCLGGERACPPEDCGGTSGYAELLEVLNDPGHPEYAELLMWLGGRFDPEAFALGAVNRRLRRLQ